MDEPSQAWFTSRKNVVHVPARAACGVTSSQWVPPSDVRRILFVPEPAAHPVLRLNMRIDAGGSSGEAAPPVVGVGHGRGLVTGAGTGRAGRGTPPAFSA